MDENKRITLGMCNATLEVFLERHKFGDGITDESFDLVFSVSQRCDCSSETIVKFSSCNVAELEEVRDRINCLIEEQKSREIMLSKQGKKNGRK